MRESNQREAREATAKQRAEDGSVRMRAASPPPPTSSGSSSSSSAARAAQLFASLDASWAGRTTRSSAELSANLTSTVRSLLAIGRHIPDATLHRHRDSALRPLEYAATATLAQPTPDPSPPAPIAIAAPTETTDTAEAAATAATAAPAAPAPAPYILPLHLQHLFLRLLLLQSRRLPPFIHAVWQRSSESDPPTPLAPGMDLDSFLAFITRAHRVASATVDTQAAKMLLLATPSPSAAAAAAASSSVSAATSSPSSGGWSSLLCSISLHIELLAYCCSPSSVLLANPLEPEDVRGSHKVAARLQALFGQPAVMASVRTYDQLQELLSQLVAVLEAEALFDSLDRIALRMLSSWRTDGASAASSVSPLSAAAAVAAAAVTAAHDPSFVVHAAPPSMAQHSTLMRFVSLVRDTLLKEDQVRAAQNALTASASPSSTEQLRQRRNPLCAHFVKAITNEAVQQFDECVATASAPQRCLIPLFALIGLSSSSAVVVAGERQPDDLHTLLRKVRSELQRMLRFVLSMPEVRGMALQQVPSSSSHAAAATWPCSNALNVACPSCLFVWLASAAVVYASTQADSIPPPQPPNDQSESEPESSSAGTAAWLLMRSFLQIADCTWLLHGAIQAAPSHAEPSTPPPTPAEPTAASAVVLPPSPSLSPSPSKLSVDRARSLQLLAWTRSPFYELLPLYSRALSSAFLALQQQPQGLDVQTELLGVMWQRVKYIHLVWRWHAQHATPTATTTTASASAAVTSIRTQLAQASLKANNRIRNIAQMQPTNNPVSLPEPVAPASSSTSSDPAPSLIDGASASPSHLLLRVVPVTLPSMLLNRTHATLAMSVTMVLAGIAKDRAWQSSCLGTPPPRPDAIADLVAQADRGKADQQQQQQQQLQQRQRLHAYSIACMLDILSYTEFARTSDDFAPFKELMAILLAMATGKEVPSTATDSSSSSTTAASAAPATPAAAATSSEINTGRAWVRQAELAQRASLHRISFARCILRTYFRCFFQPDFGVSASPSPSSSSSFSVVEHLPLFLGLDAAPSQVVEATLRDSTRWSASGSTSLSCMLGQSGRLFAPLLLRTHRDLVVPKADSTPWPALCGALATRATASFVQSEPSFAARCFFLAGLFRGCLDPRLVDPTLQMHYVLPWTWALVQHPQKELNARVQDLLTQVLHNAYLQATRGGAAASTAEENELCESSAIKPLPPTLCGAALEAYVRSLLPFYVHVVVGLYPRVVSSRSLADSLLTLFATLPSTDLALLAALRLLRDRAAAMLNHLMQQKTTLVKWRRVTDLLEEPNEQEDDEREEIEAREEASGDEGDQETPTLSAAAGKDGSTAPSWMHRVPPNVRLPRHFPRESFSRVRALLLLYLHLMQQLDAPLFGSALGLLTDLLERTLDPAVHPVATPLRASVAQLIHATLVRGFDLYKRDQAVRWYIDIVRRLHIPIGIKQPRQPTIGETTRQRQQRSKQTPAASPTSPLAALALRRA